MVSHCACSGLPNRALHEHRRPSSPPLVPFSGHASNESLPILHSSLRGSGRGCPLLRASNEHSFIVRVLRARRAPGHSFPLGSGMKFLSQSRLLQSFFIEIQGSRNSFPRSLSPLHKSLLHIRVVLALHFFKALLTSKGVDHIVPDDSDGHEPVLLPGPQSHGARGTGEGVRQVGWGQAG